MTGIYHTISLTILNLTRLKPNFSLNKLNFTYKSAAREKVLPEIGKPFHINHGRGYWSVFR